MKHRSIFFIVPFSILIFSSCGAQEKPAGDCLTVDGGMAHDFGTISHGDKPVHAFEFHNTCEDTVRFTAVKASCSCTAALPTNDVVAPGEKAAINVTFFPPRSSNGHVEKSVSVYVNDESRPRFLLRVSADITSGFSTDPGKVDMGRIPARKEAATKVRFTNISAEEREIVAVQAVLSIENRGIDGKGAPNVVPITESAFSPSAFSLAPGATQEVVVRFTPRLSGKLMGSVIIYSGPEARQVEFTGVIE
jgi:hypothetical protein